MIQNMIEETSGDAVTRFYAALAAKDPDAVRAFVAKYFADDVVLVLPGSLPYGGRVEGARRLAGMFAHVAAATPTEGVQNLRLVTAVDGGSQIAAHLTFDWAPADGGQPFASSVLELWTFDGGVVISIEAFYFDTAALVGVASP